MWRWQPTNSRYFYYLIKYVFSRRKKQKIYNSISVYDCCPLLIFGFGFIFNLTLLWILCFPNLLLVKYIWNVYFVVKPLIDIAPLLFVQFVCYFHCLELNTQKQIIALSLISNKLCEETLFCFFILPVPSFFS